MFQILSAPGHPLGRCAWRTLRLQLVIIAAIMCTSAPLFAQEVRIEPGFVLEVSALGVPGFRARATVSPSGNIAFPLIDTMQVGGLTLAEIGDRIKGGLAKRPFRQRTPDGRENFIVVAPEELQLEIAAYPPVYLTGDVAKPGEQNFRSGLTIRQAIAVAGGVDVLQRRLRHPQLEMADLRQELDVNWLEYAKQRTKQIALQAELDGSRNPDFKGQIKTPLAASVVDRIALFETARLNTAQDDHQKELEFLKTASSQLDSQISSLQEQKDIMDATNRQSAADLERLRGLYENKTISMARMTDEQRQLAYAYERRVQVVSQLNAAERARSETRRKLEGAPEQRRLKLLIEIQETGVRVDVLRAKIRALDEKIAISGKGAADQDQAGVPQYSIVVHRREGARIVRIESTEDEALRPGDVVDIVSKRPKDDIG